MHVAGPILDPIFLLYYMGDLGPITWHLLPLGFCEVAEKDPQGTHRSGLLTGWKAGKHQKAVTGYLVPKPSSLL